MNRVFIPTFELSTRAATTISQPKDALRRLVRLSLLLYEEIHLEVIPGSSRDWGMGGSLFEPLESRATRSGDKGITWNEFDTQLPFVKAVKIDRIGPEEQKIAEELRPPQSKRIAHGLFFSPWEKEYHYSSWHTLQKAVQDHRSSWAHVTNEAMSSFLNASIASPCPTAFPRFPETTFESTLPDVSPVVLDSLITLRVPDFDSASIETIAKHREDAGWTELRSLISRVAQSIIHELPNGETTDVTPVVDKKLLQEISDELAATQKNGPELVINIIVGAIGLIPFASVVAAALGISNEIADFLEDRRSWISFLSRLERASGDL